MKKLSMMALGIVGLLTMTGFGIGEAVEYLQVTRTNVSESIRENIPLDVEIDRMELLLKKMDQQISKQKYQVAKSQVALEDAESGLERDRNKSDELMVGMRSLRGLQSSESETVQVGCHTVSHTDVRQALQHKLASYKAQLTTVQAREQVVTRQRQACDTLTKRYGDWQLERQLLSQRIESLRARFAAHQAGQPDTSVFDTADLSPISELADRIEQRLRIAETQAALGSDPLDRISDSLIDNANLEAEVDRLLGDTEVAVAN